MNTNERETATMLWACVKCTARRAAELLHCPHCGHPEYQEAPGGDVEDGAPVLSAAPADTPAGPETAAAKPKAAKKTAAAKMSEQAQAQLALREAQQAGAAVLASLDDGSTPAGTPDGTTAPVTDDQAAG